MSGNILVCLNFNDYYHCEKLVNAIRDYRLIDKIIIVDNCSTHDSFEKLQDLSGDKVIVIKNAKNGGYAKGNNFGIKFAELNFEPSKILICNPDVYFSEDTLERILNTMQENTNIAICAPAMRFSYKTDVEPPMELPKHCILGLLRRFLLFRFFYNKCKRVKKFHDGLNYVSAVQGAFFVADYCKWREIGFFDEGTFLYFEENILAKKIKDKNWDIVVDASCEYIHDHGTSIFKHHNRYNIFRMNLRSEKYFWFKIVKISAFFKIFYSLLYWLLIMERYIISKFIRN